MWQCAPPECETIHCFCCECKIKEQPHNYHGHQHSYYNQHHHHQPQMQLPHHQQHSHLPPLQQLRPPPQPDINVYPSNPSTSTQKPMTQQPLTGGASYQTQNSGGFSDYGPSVPKQSVKQPATKKHSKRMTGKNAPGKARKY